ncbi:SIMPL domain-containing protein [Defluviimonas sp. SAOS-178_SWC]|uniref:SIMPL domain-containing protein n=1 Tax=Defluviimonas sp. SAOS-178_SWC TaxID=3121287 RepID=UPI0032220B59
MRVLNLFAIVLLLAGPAVAADMPATISVTGEGRVEAAPDMATISLGVTNDAGTAAEAMAANSDAVRAVIERLTAAGVEERDIQTSGLSLGPRYDYGRSDGTPPTIVGYSASNMVTVRVRALDTLGGVLDAVVAGGANTLNGLSFGIAEDREVMDEARTRAVADAARKAGLYANAAGVRLGRVLSISEAGAYQPPMPMAMAEAGFAKSAAVPVAPGEVNIVASVSVVYEIAD